MHTLSLKKLTSDLSEENLKVILIALDSLHRNFENKKSRAIALLNIYKAEKDFNFEVDVHSIVTNPSNFLTSIGLLIDTLYDDYYDLASSNGTLKPLEEDNRVDHMELLDFLETDLSITSKEA